MQLLVSLNMQLFSALIFLLDYVAEHDVFSCFVYLHTFMKSV